MKTALPFVESVDALNCLLKGTTEALGRYATIEYSQDAAPHGMPGSICTLATALAVEGMNLATSQSILRMGGVLS